MINFWRYLFGYLKIKICGKNAEKILNVAAKNKIHIWAMHCKKGDIIGNISIKDFYKLRIAKRGIKCSIKILKRHGILFYTNKYKMRLGFMSGFIIFMISLNFLSGYIWVINIEGNKTVSDNQIINSCKKIGVYEGIRTDRINPQNDAQRLLLKENNLAWASFNIEGSVLNINVSEIVPQNDILEGKPVNIKASFDGKIEKLNISRGNAVVKQGDFVAKGDLLVSGVIEQYGTTAFVHSQGEIIALTERIFIEKGDYSQKINVDLYSGNRYALKIFNITMPLFLKNHTKNYSTAYFYDDIKLFNNRIPLKIITENYKLKETISYTYSKEDLIDKLRKKIEKTVKNHKFLSYEYSNEEIIETKEGITLKIGYKCRENIATFEEILLGGGN